jgi:uncharacterized 2Fe-2S/4Fe-4S cluster protein (DUF4445 family)
MIKIKTGSAGEIYCNKGDNLFKVLVENGCIFPENCGGNGSCGNCGVLDITTGEMIKSCCYTVNGDMNLFVSERKQKVLTSYDSSLIQYKPKAFNAYGYGVAIDLGTTTIAMELINRAENKVVCSKGFPNPEIAVGADVISRIKAASDENQMHRLRAFVMADIEKSLNNMLKESHVKPSELYDIHIAGNTAMLSIVSGLTTENLGAYPFHIKNRNKVVFSGKDVFRDKELFHVSISCLPNISAFAGGDVLAGGVLLGLSESEAYRMIIDLGTNGEIILANNTKGIAASTACGPAFAGEGGNVTGTSITSAIAALLRRGQIDSHGVIQGKEFESGINYDGKLIIDMPVIRNFQLAKSAIYTGIYLVCKKAEIEPGDIKEIYIAGGFGFHLDIQDAVYTGLLPAEFSDRIRQAGNTSLAGAHMSVMDSGFIKAMEELSQNIVSLQLADDSLFSKEYIRNIDFPI